MTEQHWLKFDANRRVTGCQCGFAAEHDDCGWGDSVVDHLIDVGRTSATSECGAHFGRNPERLHLVAICTLPSGHDGEHDNAL